MDDTLPAPSRPLFTKATILEFSQQTRALCSLALGAFLISFSGVWVRLSHVPSTTSAFYRVFFGAAFLSLLVIANREWRLPRRTSRGLLPCGLFFAGDLFLYHISIEHVGPGLATLLPNFQVFIMTAAGVFLLKETVSRWFLLAMPLALVGLLMITGLDWRVLAPAYRLGIYAGLGTALCYAGFLLSLRSLQSHETSAHFYVICLVCWISAFFLAVQIIFSGGTFAIPDLQSGISLVALGFFSQTLGWWLITNGLPPVAATISGLVLLLQPALAFVWDVLFFRRPTSLVNWAGAALALAAIYLAVFRKAREKPAD